ncbi:hypothetical protein GGR51DRAFT_506255 [Nemania sp. FL0031]|nr:hypothetical protein GGR51DRAFT_506255 [Nemania sp. FL0031]
MSASAPQQLASASPDITYISSEPFEPKPLIADILRTRFCVPDSIFLVEGIDIAHTSKSKRWRVIRLLLGDGDLCIQALLAAEMHRFVDRGEICFGSYVKLQQFRVEWKEVTKTSPAPSQKDSNAAESSQSKEQMVYLVVDSLIMVGWNNTLIDDSIAGEVELGPEYVEVEREDHQDPPVQPLPTEQEKASPPDETVAGQPEIKEEKASVDIDDDFEVMDVSQNTTAHHRKEVETAIVNHERDITGSSRLHQPSNIQSRPLKLTKLRSIPNLPFKQNWSVNVLCVVSAISDVEPAGIPPYTQRQARLTDPSTDKHVLLTVFLDPPQFNPKVGSVVLLFGVKNHRFDGGSLKKYASDKPKPGEHWWYESPTQFSYCDVDGLRQWWAQNGVQA